LTGVSAFTGLFLASAAVASRAGTESARNRPLRARSSRDGMPPERPLPGLSASRSVDGLGRHRRRTSRRPKPVPGSARAPRRGRRGRPCGSVPCRFRRPPRRAPGGRCRASSARSRCLPAFRPTPGADEREPPHLGVESRQSTALPFNLRQHAIRIHEIFELAQVPLADLLHGRPRVLTRPSAVSGHGSPKDSLLPSKRHAEPPALPASPGGDWGERYGRWFGSSA